MSEHLSQHLDEDTPEEFTTDTLFVNLFAGPGTGKSRNAAKVFGDLKDLGYNAEQITEYAKKKVWAEEKKTLDHQLYVTAKQTHAQFQVLGQVEVAITDSPILLGPFVYPGFGSTPSFIPYMLEVFGQFNNLNIYLVRDPEYTKYNPKGRNQNEAQAIEIDKKVRASLDAHNIPYHLVTVGPNVVNDIVAIIQQRLHAE